MISLEFIAGLKSQGMLGDLTIGDAYDAYKEEVEKENRDTFMKFRSSFIMYGDGLSDIPGYEQGVDKVNLVEEKDPLVEEIVELVEEEAVTTITEESNTPPILAVIESDIEHVEGVDSVEGELVSFESTEEVVDLDVEEDEDWDKLEVAGVITPIVKAKDTKPFPLEDATEEVVEVETEEAVEESFNSDETILNQAPTKSEAKIIAELEVELKDELAEIAQAQAESVRPKPVVETNDLPTRVVKTYCNGEELPEVPGLIPTGTMFDKLISDRFTTEKQLDEYMTKFGEEMPDEEFEAGGFTRKCVDIVAGDPGAGKTTNLATLAAKAKIFARRELGKEIKVSFISAEMRESEWAKELRDSELLRELEVTYMLDYVGYENYEDIFWEAFADGDVVICDSFPAIVDHIRMNPKEKRTEKAITADFIRKSLKSVTKNNNNVQLINQATKDGNYKGGTILPHMLSSLSFVRLDGEKRFWEYRKNRNNGKVGRRGYFGRSESRDIVFDEELYMSTYEQVADKEQSIEDLLNSLDTNPRAKEAFERLGESDNTLSEEAPTTEEVSVQEKNETAVSIAMGDVSYVVEDDEVESDVKESVEEIPFMGRALSNGQTDLEDLIQNAVAEVTSIPDILPIEEVSNTLSISEGTDLEVKSKATKPEQFLL